MILKAEILLDIDSGIVRADDIDALLRQVFKDNDHIARLKTCVVKEAVKEHKWEFYMNGTFCTICGAQLGNGQPCI